MKPKILIVDDDEMLCEELAEILAGNGYNAQTAPDGREGLQAIGKSRYDLILLDIKMPHMDGLEVLREIKRKKKAPKVLILSANPSVDGFLGAAVDMPQDYSQNILKLADGVMGKPYDVEILLAKIRDLLSAPASEQPRKDFPSLGSKNPKSEILNPKQ